MQLADLLHRFLGGLLYRKTGYQGVAAASFAVLAVDFLMRVLVIEKKVAHRYEVGDPNSQYTPGAAPGQVDREEEGEESNANDGDEEQPLLPKNRAEEELEYRLPEDKSRIAHAIPILPCLSNASLLTSLWLALVQAILLGACDATITTVSRDLFNFDSLEAGVLFLPIGLVDLVCSPLAGWIVDRRGTKLVSVVSFTFLVPILILLRLPQAGGIKQVVLYGGLLGLLGIGLSGTGAPSIVEAGSVMEKYHEYNRDFFGESGPYAQLYGLNSMMFNLGLTVGPELAGELKGIMGYGNMNIVLAGICAVTAILSAMFIGGQPKFVTGTK
jgi:hypothetical protein